MKLQTLPHFFRISSRKFYQIVGQRKEELLPPTPEELILSKYLKGEKSNLPEMHNPPKADLKGSKIVNYQEIMERNPYGSIIEQPYKGHTLSLVSLDFRNIQLKNILDICSQFKPDLVFVQGSPENYLPGFQLFPKRNSTFSDQLYLSQLTVPQSHLKRILSGEVCQYFKTLNEGQTLDQKVLISSTNGLVQDEVILAACYHSSKSKAKVMLGEMPLQPYREWLLNSHTLMEIQELFKGICKNVPFYQTLELSLQRLACLLKPSIFLNLRDRYMATLLEMVIATGKHPRILAILGSMQNQSVLQLLQNDALLSSETGDFTPIMEYLIGPPTKSSIIRNVSGWEIIEKHLILDIMKHGEDILNIPVESLELTNKMSEHYGILLNSYGEEQLMKFRYEKTLEYLQVMRSQVEEGRQLKKKFMLREAIRTTQDAI